MSDNNSDVVREMYAANTGDSLSAGNPFAMLMKAVSPQQPTPKSTKAPVPLPTSANKAQDEATLTPTEFCEAFSNRGISNQLKKSGVKKINISSGNVDMVFEFSETTGTAEEWADAPYINSQDIITYGVAQAVALNEKVIIHNDRDVVGFLSVRKTDSALAKIGANRNENPLYVDNRGKIGLINAMSVFKDSATIGEAISHSKASGGLRLYHIFETASGRCQSLEIGRLLDLDSLKKKHIDVSNLRRISTEDIITALSSEEPETPDQLITSIFKDARRGYALYLSEHSPEDCSPFPVAAFIPLKKTLG